ncbi:MAG: fibronectin type III domain-containing protein [Bacteroides sp.]|nr:fibronectin type III domain-containing protein [Ruminococcus flavefaciens]MCM1555278.1 fibronectin type III domain-containing protein [Bacteroides sp.]
MKKLLLLFVCLLAVGSMAWAGSPINKYTGEKTALKLHTFSDAATEISYLKVEDTLGFPLTPETVVFLGENGLERRTAGTREASFLRNIGFEFPLGDSLCGKFGISANGVVYFGVNSIQLGGLGNKGMQTFSSSTSNYLGMFFFYDKGGTGSDGIGDNKVGYSAVVSGVDTKIRYETVQDTLFIGFEKLLVCNQTDKRMEVSFQYRIEKSGKVSFLVNDMSAEANSGNYHVRLVFRSVSNMVFVKFEDGSAEIYGNNPAVTVNNTQPFSGAMYSLVPPTPCEAVSGVIFSWNPALDRGVEEIALTPSGRLWNPDQEGAEAKGCIVVLTDSDQSIKEKLQDKKVYTSRDSIDKQWPVLSCRENGYASGKFTALSAGTTYYLHAFPYKVNCADGPIYGQEEIHEVQTSIENPKGLTVQAIGKNDITLGVDMESNYVLAVAEKRVITYDGKVVKELLTDGQTYSLGDEVEYNNYGAPFKLRIVAAGASAETVKVENLEEGKAYYFYLWNMTGTGADVRYSASYMEAIDRTISPVPAEFGFGNLLTAESAGWNSHLSDVGSEDFEIDAVSFDFPVFAANSIATNQESGVVSAWTTTPWMEGTGDIQAVFNVSLYTKSGSTLETSISYLKTLKTSDSVVFQLQEQGETAWRTVARLNSTTPWTAGFNEIVTSKHAVSKPFRYRVVFYQNVALVGGDASPCFGIKGVNVEESLPCQYPVGIVAPEDRMDYGSVEVQWTDNNSPYADHFIVRYAKAAVTGGNEGIGGMDLLNEDQDPDFGGIGDDDFGVGDPGEGDVEVELVWSDPVTVKEQAVVLKNLEPGVPYVAEVRAVCAAQDSSTAKTVSFTTLLGIPYEKGFATTSMVPTLAEFGMTAMQGVLGAELSEPVAESVTWAPFYDDADKVWTVGLWEIESARLAWMMLPKLFAGNNGRARLSVEMSAYNYNSDTERKTEATGINADMLFVLRSADGTYNRSQVIGFIELDSVKTAYKNFDIEFDVQARSSNNIAFYFPGLKAENGAGKLAIAGIKVEYSEIIYPAVTGIRTSGLNTSGVTVSWEGNAESYALMYKERSAAKYDTVYTDQKSYTLTGLKSATQYAYRIFGYYGPDKTLPGEVSSERYVNILRNCLPPTDLAVVGVTWQGVTLFCSKEKETDGRQCLFTAQEPERYPDVNYLGSWRADGKDTCYIGGFVYHLNFPYRAAVRTICAPGDTSAWSNTVDFTTAKDVPECGTPYNMKSEYSATTRTATLSWERGENNDGITIVYIREGSSVFDTAETEASSYLLPNVRTEAVYYWKLQAVCDNYLLSRVSEEQEVEMVANESADYARALRIRVNGRQIVVENPEHRLIKALNVYGATGVLLKSYKVNASDNVFIYTELNQGVVVIEAVGETEKTAVKAVIM